MYIYIHIYVYIYTYIYIYIYILVLLTLLRRKKMLLLFIVLWKHGNTLLSEISSFYAYVFFREFRTPLDSEPATPLPLQKYKKVPSPKLFRLSIS